MKVIDTNHKRYRLFGCEKMKDINGKYKLVIFDLDGTLMDTSQGILSSIEYTIKETKMRELSREEMQSFIGPPIQKSFANVYGVEVECAERLAGIFRERYSTVDLLKAVPYEGIYELLKELSMNQIKTAVATYKREDYALKLLREFHFDDYMNSMYGSDMDGKLSKSDIIKKCIEDANVNFDEVVMVGDTSNDEIGAHNLGVDFIGVTYGFGFRNQSDMKIHCRNIACIDDPRQILNVL